MKASLENKIFTNIKKHVALESLEEDLLLNVLSVESVAKKTLVLEQGKEVKKLYFVESGSLRAYNTNEQGKESTIMFAITDWWITDMFSFVNKKPALVSLETIEESQLCSIDCESLEFLLHEIPKLERFFRIIFQKAYVREQLRTLQMISSPLEERYNTFIEKYPKIVEKVTQKQIASYLGVTPEFLSTIKRGSRS